MTPIFFAACTKPFFFFLPPWYEYLNLTTDSSGNCQVANFKVPNDILPVGLAILDMLIRVAGLVAIVAVIAAGVSYITAQGNVEKAASARRRAYNGLIGLAIVSVAATLVTYIGKSLGG